MLSVRLLRLWSLPGCKAIGLFLFLPNLDRPCIQVGASFVDISVTASLTMPRLAPAPRTLGRSLDRSLCRPRRVACMTSLEQRFVAGSEDALADAYAEHGSLVFSFCRRQLGTEEARDVTQEVFVAAWKARQRFDESRGSLRGWLMSIAKNKVIDVFRRQARRPQTVGGIEFDQLGAGQPSTVEPGIGRTADRMVLVQALQQLPERARAVVELSFFQQLTHVEIAEQTGLPLGTVKSDLRRSLIRLRHELEDADV